VSINHINSCDPSINIQLIKAKFKEYQPFHQPLLDFKPAAVIMLLYQRENTLQFVMEVRSSKLTHHRGEISFPGGRFDPIVDHSMQETGLRETYEEIGVSPNKIEILGQMDDIPMFTGYMIHPFIGYILSDSNLQFQPNAEEVSEILLVPITFFQNPLVAKKIEFDQFGIKHPVLSMDYFIESTKKHYNIWGASAHMIARFMNIVYSQDMFGPNYMRPSAEQINAVLKTNQKK
jgi:8-oxo-dGTP pyrophosphatase MutT (NUDIX family)